MGTPYYVPTGKTIGAIRAGRIEERYRPLPVDPTWDPDRDRYPSYGHRRPIRADDIEQMAEAEYERRTSNGQTTICPVCHVAESLLTGECDCGDAEQRMLRLLAAAGVDVPSLRPKPIQPVDRQAKPLVAKVPAGAVTPASTVAGRWGTLVLVPYAVVTHYFKPTGQSDISCRVYAPVCGLGIRGHVDDWLGTPGWKGRRAAPTVTVDPNVDRCPRCEAATSDV